MLMPMKQFVYEIPQDILDPKATSILQNGIDKNLVK
jgi:hypothetical protein